MKKIMFNDKYRLTKAVLERIKTHTRRIISTNLYNRVDWKAFEEGNYDCVITDDASTVTDIRDYAAYRVGEEVAVAQNYNTIIQEIFDKGGEFKDSCSIFMSKGLNNKMFVRADRMPHRIKIINVRVERLQDISEEDCLKEGIIQSYNDCLRKKIFGFYDGNKKAKLTASWIVDVGFDTPIEAFAALIDKTCGRGTWDSNPYVFVYDFELIK